MWVWGRFECVFDTESVSRSHVCKTTTCECECECVLLWKCECVRSADVPKLCRLKLSFLSVCVAVWTHTRVSVIGSVPTAKAIIFLYPIAVHECVCVCFNRNYCESPSSSCCLPLSVSFLWPDCPKLRSSFLVQLGLIACHQTMLKYQVPSSRSHHRHRHRHRHYQPNPHCPKDIVQFTEHASPSESEGLIRSLMLRLRDSRWQVGIDMITITITIST